MRQILGQELYISSIGQASVIISLYSFVCIESRVAEYKHELAPKTACMREIELLCSLGIICLEPWVIKEFEQSNEFHVVQALFHSHVSQSLTIVPYHLIGNPENI